MPWVSLDVHEIAQSDISRGGNAKDVNRYLLNLANLSVVSILADVSDSAIHEQLSVCVYGVIPLGVFIEDCGHWLPLSSRQTSGNEMRDFIFVLAAGEIYLGGNQAAHNPTQESRLRHVLVHLVFNAPGPGAAGRPRVTSPARRRTWTAIYASSQKHLLKELSGDIKLAAQ